MITVWWKDLKFWSIIATAIAAVLNEVLGIGISYEVVWIVIALVLGAFGLKLGAETVILVVAIKRDGIAAVAKAFKK